MRPLMAIAMANMIYGVDADMAFTAGDVRDAIIRCFVEAHASILQETMLSSGLEMGEAEVTSMKELDVMMLIEKLFKKVGGDFEHPTKGVLLAVMGELKVFSTNFRDQETIGKHYEAIKSLVDKLPD